MRLWLLAALLIAVGCGDVPEGPLGLTPAVDETLAGNAGGPSESVDTNSSQGPDDQEGVGVSPPDGDGLSLPDAADCATASRTELALVLGEMFTPQGIVEDSISPCEVRVYRGVAGYGMRLRARLTGYGDLTFPQLFRYDAGSLNAGDFDNALDAVAGGIGRVEMEWDVAQTGELALAVATLGNAGEGAFELDVRCVDNCQAGMIRYPVVLLHGMGGSDTYFNLVDYFNGVQDGLEEVGYPVFVTVADPLLPATERAAQIVPQLELILEQTGAAKLNLIGHSQGGVDGRALISAYGFGDRVASLTTVATPHYGTVLADIGTGAIDATGVLGEALVDAVGDVFGRVLGRGSQDLNGAIYELSESFMVEEFNPNHPDDPRVAYYSWNGRTCAPTEFECRRENHDEVVDPFLYAPYRANQLLGFERSDGLVPYHSAQWGTFLGEVPADHLDEVGQVVDLDGHQFDHVQFYVDEAARLFQAGY